MQNAQKCLFDILGGGNRQKIYWDPENKMDMGCIACRRVGQKCCEFGGEMRSYQNCHGKHRKHVTGRHVIVNNSTVPDTTSADPQPSPSRLLFTSPVS